MLSAWAASAVRDGASVPGPRMSVGSSESSRASAASPQGARRLLRRSSESSRSPATRLDRVPADQLVAPGAYLLDEGRERLPSPLGATRPRSRGEARPRACRQSRELRASRIPALDRAPSSACRSGQWSRTRRISASAPGRAGPERRVLDGIAEDRCPGRCERGAIPSRGSRCSQRPGTGGTCAHAGGSRHARR